MSNVNGGTDTPSRRVMMLGSLGALGVAAYDAPEAVAMGEPTGRLAEALAGPSIQSADSIGTTTSPGELRSLVGGSPADDAPEVVIVKGFWSPADGGGGIFSWDGQSSEPDNGGTVIQPTGHADAGRWKRVADEHLNVRWFGAKGDGATPGDSGFIQAAIDTLNADARPGGTLSFPPGTYAITDSMTIAKDGVSVLGDGAKIVQNGTTSTPYGGKAGFIVDAEKVMIRGLWLYNSLGGEDWDNDHGTAAIAIQIRPGANYATVRDCRLENWGQSGITVDRAKGLLIESNNIIGISVDGGLYDGSNGNFGVYGTVSAAAVAGLRILGNEISESTQGIFLGNNWDVDISHNYIHDIRGQGALYIDNPLGLVISSNRIRATGRAGIKVQVEHNATSDCENVLIDGNTIDSAGESGILMILAVGGGFDFKNVMSSNNTVRAAGVDGIYVNAVDQYQIIGNVVRGSARYGVFTGGANSASKNGRIAGNYISESGATGIYASQVDNTSYLVIVTDNVIFRPVQGCSVQGCGDGVADNTGMFLSTGNWLVRDNIMIGPAGNAYLHNLYLHSAGRATILDNTGVAGFSNRIDGTVNNPRSISVTWSASMEIDLGRGATEFVIDAKNAAPALIGNPVNRTSASRFTIRVRNVTAGLTGDVTMGSTYRLAGTKFPMPGAGHSRTVDFSWDDASQVWVEVSRTPTEVPN